MISIIYYENECCGCATEGYPCSVSNCPNRHVLHMECDRCGAECDELYYGVDGNQLCADCVLKELEKVEVE